MRRSEIFGSGRPSQMAPIPFVHGISACGLSADEAKILVRDALIPHPASASYRGHHLRGDAFIFGSHG